jgi:hypothetical protein
MGRLFGIVELELRPGVSEAEVEQLLAQFAAQPQPPGTRFYTLKGNRGKRDGQYLVLTEFESVVERDRYWPATNQPSDEMKAFETAHPARNELLARISPLFSEEENFFTDYEVISASE